MINNEAVSSASDYKVNHRPSRQDSDLIRARNHALRLINYRPRSEKELQNRLKERGYSQEIIGIIAGEFKAKGLIDDKAFARLWVRMRSQTTPRGLSAIKRELFLKEVDGGIADEAIGELKKNFDEEAVARGLLNKRLALMKGLDKQKQKARLFGYLKRRGFSDEVVYKLLNETY